MRRDVSSHRLLRVAALVTALAPLPQVARADSSGDLVAIVPTDEMSDTTRDTIQRELDASIARLFEEGRLAPEAATAPSAPGVLLDWPLRPRPGLDWFAVHGISAHVDQDPAATTIQDYNCGTRTYDGHHGTDIFLWPFSWNLVDDDAVAVVAAADGVLIGKSDGNFDRNCASNSNTWNAAFVRHADGSVAWYGHMKNGSVTARAVGDPIVTGEQLGIVASSGSSTGPHLHFELHDAAGAILDPFTGPCNRLNPDSWWALQRAYTEPTVNKLMTSFAVPQLNNCPAPGVTNEAFVFRPGDTVWFSRFYHDQVNTGPSVATIFRPDRSVFRTWSSTIPDPYYAASWGWNQYTIGAAEPLGKWQFEVQYQGRTYDHDFWLVGPGPWLLRNASVTSIAPLSRPLAAIFVGAGATTLDLGGRDGVPRPGEGDDDDAYVPDFAAGQLDPDATVVGDASRPLVFYQVSGAATSLTLVKSAGALTISY